MFGLPVPVVHLLRPVHDSGPLVVSAPPTFAARWLVARIHVPADLIDCTLPDDDGHEWDPPYPGKHPAAGRAAKASRRG